MRGRGTTAFPCATPSQPAQLLLAGRRPAPSRSRTPPPPRAGHRASIEGHGWIHEAYNASAYVRLRGRSHRTGVPTPPGVDPDELHLAPGQVPPDLVDRARRARALATSLVSSGCGRATGGPARPYPSTGRAQDAGRRPHRYPVSSPFCGHTSTLPRVQRLVRRCPQRTGRGPYTTEVGQFGVPVARVSATGFSIAYCEPNSEREPPKPAQFRAAPSGPRPLDRKESCSLSVVDRMGYTRGLPLQRAFTRAGRPPLRAQISWSSLGVTARLAMDAPVTSG